MASVSDLQQFGLELLETLDTPRSLTAAILIKYGEWDQLVRLRTDPSQYEPYFFSGVAKFRKDYLASEFLRKAVDLPLAIDREAVARNSFLETERICAESNLRLDAHISNPVYTELKVRADALLVRAKSWIAATLGPLPDVLDGRFGPGATFESAVWSNRQTMVAFDKLRNTPSRTSGITEPLVDHLVWETVMGTAWGASCLYRQIPISRGNRFASVPKDATKDRGIAIEPGLNVWGQLAIGQVMRIRLNRRGIDLEYGQGLHQKLAALASHSGRSSTIDLSNASNTVCRNLVKLLLPDLWYDLLSCFRSPMTLFSPSGKKSDERWYRLEMFSSMGNGYTFELETLIFSALAHAVGGRIGRDSFVYGDDIIVPTEVSADLLALLRYCGFTPNPKKTYTTGYFRESCGGDFFNGADVRPFYVESYPATPAALIVLANQLFSWAQKWGLDELLAVRKTILCRIPTKIRNCRGPRELGDCVVHDFPENWNCRVRNSVRYFRVWRPVLPRLTLKEISSLRFRYTSPLTGLCTARTFAERDVALTAAVLRLPSVGLTPRDSVSGWRFGRVMYS